MLPPLEPNLPSLPSQRGVVDGVEKTLVSRVEKALMSWIILVHISISVADRPLASGLRMYPRITPCKHRLPETCRTLYSPHNTLIAHLSLVWLIFLSVIYTGIVRH